MSVGGTVGGWIDKAVSFNISGLKYVLKTVGLESNLTAKIVVTYILAAVVVAVFLYAVKGFFKTMVYNSLAGITILLILHYGFNMLPLTPFTLLFAAAGGMGAVAGLLTMYVGGALLPPK